MTRPKRKIPTTKKQVTLTLSNNYVRGRLSYHLRATFASELHYFKNRYLVFFACGREIQITKYRE